jgi:hypothetical protein
MNEFALRLFIRSLITEAKENPKDTKDTKDTKLPKSSGKLMDLKKELAALEQYRDEIQVAKFAEQTASTEIQFADLAKFKKELDAIKEKGIKLESDLEAKIEEVKAKIDAQKDKIKELMGMPVKDGQEPMVDETFKSTEKKIEKNIRSSEKKKGESTKGAAEYAKKVAGKIAQEKAHGAGTGPTAKQKTKMK